MSRPFAALALATALSLPATTLLAPALIAPALISPALAQAAPEDPVVARVNGDAIRRSDVIAAHQGLPPQVQQMPIETIFPLIVDQLVNDRLIAAAGRSQKLQDDPEVKNRLAQLENRVILQVYLTRLVEKAVTEEALKERYAAFAKAAPSGEEVKASHILVEKEDDAKKIIADLKKGGDFERTAREKSIDPGGRQTGGDLGFFTREQMVPEFANAAFNMKKGELADAPVKSQFGWHVIKVTDRRTQAPPSLEESRAELSQELTREVVQREVDRLKEGATVELFQLDGSPLAAPGGAPGLTPAPSPPAGRPAR